ncbi:MAG: hypothetical protein MR679_07435 [Bacteroidales bacterium]|nr:hypothetical protein [Bacteroidales bacterium]
MWMGAITGTWTNTYALDMMNAVLGSSFTAADFGEGSPLKYTASGAQGSKSTLSLTLPSSYTAGDAIVFYLSVSSNVLPLNNFSVTGLNKAVLSYASNNGSGFSFTPTYSRDASAITIVKVVGKVTSSRQVEFASTTAKNAWQTVSYCPLTAEEYNAEAKPAALASLDAKLAKGRLKGTGLGQYAYSGNEDADQIIATAKGLLTSETATIDEIYASIAALDRIYAGFSLNMPVAGKLYRFKGKYSGNYISPTNSTDKMAMQADASLRATVFMLTEENKLLSCNMGYYTTGTYSCSALKAAANTVTFAESTTYLGYYTLKSNAGGAGQWFYDESSNVNRNGSYAADRCDWMIEEITTMPIPVSDTYKIGTFVSPVPLCQDDATLKFYTGEIVGNYLVLTKHEGNIPANTPFLIEYQDGAPYANDCVNLDIAASADELGRGVKNNLAGSIETVAKPSGTTIYTLQPASSGAQELTFRIFNGSTLAGGKAYLPSESLVKGIRYNTGETTGIEGVATEKANKEIFDLSGRRVQNPTSGLYIINGQKVYVK